MTVALTLKGDGMATVVIFGRVIQPEGSSLGARRVEIFAKGAQEPSPLVAARVRTDGAFEAEIDRAQVPPGDGRRARVVEFRVFHGNQSLQIEHGREAELRRAPRLKVEIAVASPKASSFLTIRGQVTNANAAVLPGLSVVALRLMLQGKHEEVGHATTDKDGKYSVDCAERVPRLQPSLRSLPKKRSSRALS